MEEDPYFEDEDELREIDEYPYTEEDYREKLKITEADEQLIRDLGYGGAL